MEPPRAVWSDARQLRRTPRAVWNDAGQLLSMSLTHLTERQMGDVHRYQIPADGVLMAHFRHLSVSGRWCSATGMIRAAAARIVRLPVRECDSEDSISL